MKLFEIDKYYTGLIFLDERKLGICSQAFWQVSSMEEVHEICPRNIPFNTSSLLRSPLLKIITILEL